MQALASQSAPAPLHSAAALPPPCVLVIDDHAHVRELFASILQDEPYRLEFAESGAAGLGLATALEPDLVLLDLMMPGMNGYEVCQRLRADPMLAEITIIMVTALDDRDTRLKALGNLADEFLTKPIDKAEVRARVRTLTRLNRYRQLVNQRRLLEQTVAGLAQLLMELQAQTEPHQARRNELVCELATTLGNDLAHDAGEANEVHLAAMLAGLGRMVVPERILEAHRRGITLTDGETEVWRRIPSTGHALLRHLPGFEDVARSVLLQACRFDGGGPGNVSEKGEALPLGARILKFCHDLADIEATGHVRRNAVALLAKRTGAYDLRVVQAAEFLWALPLATTRELSARYCFAAAVADLRQGQTLRSDVLTADGMLLVAAGKQLTSTVLERILNFAESCGVREPIEVDALLPRAA